MLVARFTESPAADLERGWSGAMGPAFNSIKEAVEVLGDPELFSDEALAEVRERWEASFGYQGDDAEFERDYLEEMAEEFSLRFDAPLGKWRVFDHEGLSCFALDAESDFGAMVEAKMLAEAGVFDTFEGWATTGDVRVVARVPGIKNLWVFECDGIQVEV